MQFNNILNSMSTLISITVASVLDFFYARRNETLRYQNEDTDIHEVSRLRYLKGWKNSCIIKCYFTNSVL